jgi:hypothetical protein
MAHAGWLIAMVTTTLGRHKYHQDYKPRPAVVFFGEGAYGGWDQAGRMEEGTEQVRARREGRGCVACFC